MGQIQFKQKSTIIQTPTILNDLSCVLFLYIVRSYIHLTITTNGLYLTQKVLYLAPLHYVVFLHLAQLQSFKGSNKPEIAIGLLTFFTVK
jgi:hypothetical protein